MNKETRINEIKEEISRLKSELTVLNGHSQMEIKETLTYPAIDYKGKIVDRYVNLVKLTDTVRMALTPEWRKPKNRMEWTYAKKIKDLSEKEYNAVCNCANECISVIARYVKELHPEGIAIGEEYNGSFYKEVSNDQ